MLEEIKERITWQNIRRYAIPPSAAVANFFLGNSNPAISVGVTVVNSLGIISSDFAHNRTETHGLCNRKTIAAITAGGLTFSYVLIASLRALDGWDESKQYGSTYRNIESSFAAGCVIIPWLVNNASRKFFTLSEDLLSPEQKREVDRLLSTYVPSLNMLTLTPYAEKSFAEEIGGLSENTKTILFQFLRQPTVINNDIIEELDIDAVDVSMRTTISTSRSTIS